MKKNLLKIYDIFKSNNFIEKSDSLCDINKATNKILTSKKNIVIISKNTQKKPKYIHLNVQELRIILFCKKNHVLYFRYIVKK